MLYSLKAKGLSMRIAIAITFTLVLAALWGCSQEPVPEPLLRIEEKEFFLEEFEQFLADEHPELELPADKAVLQTYLDKYLERELLAYAADRAGVVPPSDSGLEGSRKKALIARYLAEEASRSGALEIPEQAIIEAYQERYGQARARIRSIFIEDEATATRVHRNLRNRPSRFEQYMQEYNADRTTDEGIGQGEFTRMNMPDSLGEKVFAVREGRFSEPISFGNGYVIVQVLEYLPPRDIDEVRGEIVSILATSLREEMRRGIVDKLRQELEVQFNTDLAVDALSKGGGREESQQ